MFHSTERLANYLIVKGEIRRETFLEIKNLDPWPLVALYVYAIALRRTLRRSNPVPKDSRVRHDAVQTKETKGWMDFLAARLCVG